MTTVPRPGGARPRPVRPLSIATCTYELLVAKLGDPFEGRPTVRSVTARPPVPAPQPPRADRR